MNEDWTEFIVRCVDQACRAEVSSDKPGNVGPDHSFADASMVDFLRSAGVIAPIIGRGAHMGVGATVLAAVRATKAEVGHNTNLGIILLLTPLAAVNADLSLSEGIDVVLSRLTLHDAELTYKAIQVASPGGLGAASDQDVNSLPTTDLRSCMRLASSRDQIAAQYDNGFQDVLSLGVPLLRETHDWTSYFDYRLGWLAVHFLSRFGDSLIARKCGPGISDEVRRLASNVLEADFPFSAGSRKLYRELDRFLRDSQHLKNPGTTADLIAAVIFAGLRDRYWTVNDSGMIQF